MNFEGLPVEILQERGREIARIVRRNTGIPVSIGIARTKTLAKVASKLCKKYPKLKGACLMYRPEDITKVLTKFPIGDVWGIGRRYSKMLKSHGIETARQFRQMQPEWVRAKMSIVGLRTWKELRGEPGIEFEHATPRQAVDNRLPFVRQADDRDPAVARGAIHLCVNGCREAPQAKLRNSSDADIYSNQLPPRRPAITS